MLIPHDFNRAQQKLNQLDQARQIEVVESAETYGHTIRGALAGAGLGVLSGVAMSSGVLPGLELATSTGMMIPLALGMALSAVGSIAGSFIDLTPATTKWRS